MAWLSDSLGLGSSWSVCSYAHGLLVKPEEMIDMTTPCADCMSPRASVMLQPCVYQPPAMSWNKQAGAKQTGLSASAGQEVSKSA